MSDLRCEARSALAGIALLASAAAAGAPPAAEPVPQPALRSAAAALETWIEPVTGLEFVRLPAGDFWMGSPDGEPGREEAEGHHRVTLSHATWMARTELTEEQWKRVMGTQPFHFGDCPSCPAERVSWHDAHAFAARLAQLSPGNRFRLPTEAEWEYACRAGTTTPFSTGENLTDAEANVDARYPLPGRKPGGWRGRTTPVKSYAPNAWGLYDLHGNVWEWTEDDFCPPATSPATDPQAACGAEKKVIRGGSWAFDVASARCALRYTHRPQDVGYSLGMRLVREPE